jgi:hypothetical protein
LGILQRPGKVLNLRVAHFALYFAFNPRAGLLHGLVGLGIPLFESARDQKAIPSMNHALRSCVLTGIAGLFLASTCFAGTNSVPFNPSQTHDNSSMSILRPVTIISQPAGARILINGDYVGTTPLLVDFAVDRFGRALRNIEMRVVAPHPLITRGVRLFPAAGTDGDASRIPQLVDFDLNVQSVFVIR